MDRVGEVEGEGLSNMNGSGGHFFVGGIAILNKIFNHLKDYKQV